MGELDFVVINQGADVLLIEQKAGELSETDNGLVKVYGDNAKPVPNQVHRGLGYIKRKWAQVNPGADPIDVGYLLYLPDHAVMDVNAAGRGRPHRPCRQRGRSGRTDRPIAWGRRPRVGERTSRYQVSVCGERVVMVSAPA